MIDQNQIKEFQELYDRIHKALCATSDSGKLPSFGETVYLLVNAREALSAMITQDDHASEYETHIAAKEKAHNEALDQTEEDRAERNPDTGHLWGENHDGTVNLDTEHNDSQGDLIFDERGFLLEMVDEPLPAMFERNLRPGVAEAFAMFRREGFVELAADGSCWRATNKGRERLGLEADPTL